MTMYVTGIDMSAAFDTESHKEIVTANHNLNYTSELLKEG